MMQVAENTKPNIRIDFASAAKGIVLVGVALVAGAADIHNNMLFAAGGSIVMQAAYFVAGIGLLVLPSEIKGWKDLALLIFLAICVAASFNAGYQNHMEVQRNKDLAIEAKTTAYGNAQKAIATAEQDLQRAEAEAEAIDERMGSAGLQKQYDAAEKLYNDNKETCGKICTAARKQMEALPARVAAARAREEAMGRAEEARGRMARERATAPAQALAQTVSHDEESRNAIVLLLLTIGGATLAHRGFHLLANCRKVEIVKPAKVAKVVVKATRAKKAAPAPVVEEKKDRLEKYLRAWTVASDGPPLPASEFMKGIQAHWASNYRGEPVPTACALGKALVLLYRKDKKNGKQCYFAKLRKVMIAA